MQLLDAPPCTSFAVVAEGKRHLRLEGPTAGARLTSGLSGLFGGVFGAFGASMLRAPFPLPFKAIPLAFAAIGAGVAAVGGAKAAMRCSADFKPSGITFAWTVHPFPERTLQIAARDLEDVELTVEEHSRRDSSIATVAYQLVAVTKAGKAYPFETFSTRAQANLRRKAIAAVVSLK